MEKYDRNDGANSRALRRDRLTTCNLTSSIITRNLFFNWEIFLLKNYLYTNLFLYEKANKFVHYTDLRSFRENFFLVDLPEELVKSRSHK